LIKPHQNFSRWIRNTNTEQADANDYVLASATVPIEFNIGVPHLPGEVLMHYYKAKYGEN